MDLLQVAQNIRRLRQCQQLTLEQLARKAGFSKGFISQVENFRLSPSLKALGRLAEALGVPTSELFGPEPREPEYTVGTLADGVPVRRDSDPEFGISYFALAYPQFGRQIEPFILEYRPAAARRDFLGHDTEEFFVVLEGRVVFFILDESRRFELGPGGTLYLKAGLPHRVELASGCDYARALTVYAPHPEPGKGRRD